MHLRESLKGRFSDPVIFGHMGASRDAPENTMPAFALAHASGAALELDVRGTSDGEVVVFHDDHLDRVTDGHGEIARTRYTDLCRLDAATHFRHDDGAAWAGARPLQIPHLRDVVSAFPSALINVDIHQEVPSIVGAVVDVLRLSAPERQRSGGQVILTTQHTSTMREIETDSVPAALGLCRTQVLEVLCRAAASRLLSPLGVAEWADAPGRLRDRALQIPLKHSRP